MRRPGPGAAAWIGLAGLLLQVRAGLAAVDCSASVPPRRMEEILAAASSSCGSLKTEYAKAVGDQATVLGLLRAPYEVRLRQAAPAAPDLKKVLATFDRDLARLAALGGAIQAARLPDNAASAAATAAASASAASASLAELLRDSRRLGRDLAERVATDQASMPAAEADARCRLEHYGQLGMALYGGMATRQCVAPP